MPLSITPADPITDTQWEAVCQSSPDAWYWHTGAWWAYTLAYHPSYRQDVLAFAIRDGQDVVGIVPTMLEETVPGGLSYAFGGSECWAPALAAGLTERQRQLVLGYVFVHLDRQAGVHGVATGSFRWTPIAPGGVAATQSGEAVAMRHGWIDASVVSQVLDLRHPVGQLLNGTSKGHRADITRGLRHNHVIIDDAKSIEADNFDGYRLLHRQAAGRETRPLETFQLMFGWIGEGNAILARAVCEGELVSAAYVITWRGAAYYASAASSELGRQRAAGHALQWGIIQWLHEHDVGRYELGAQYFGGLPHEVVTAKDRAISKFKRGFGGNLERAPIHRRFWTSAAWRREQDRWSTWNPAPPGGSGPAATQ